jgi:hypothetical protein
VFTFISYPTTEDTTWLTLAGPHDPYQGFGPGFEPFDQYPAPAPPLILNGYTSVVQGDPWAGYGGDMYSAYGYSSGYPGYGPQASGYPGYEGTYGGDPLSGLAPVHRLSAGRQLARGRRGSGYTSMSPEDGYY